MEPLKRGARNSPDAAAEAGHPEPQPREIAARLSPAAANLQDDRVERTSAVLSGPAARPERVALFNDFQARLPQLDSSGRDAQLADLVKKLNDADIDSIFKNVDVPRAAPETQFESGKPLALGVMQETLSTEQRHNAALTAFVSLFSNRDLQKELSPEDRKWLTAALSGLQNALSVSAQLLTSFHLATGTIPGSDVSEAIKQMTPEQRRAASENLLRSFGGFTFKKQFVDASNDLNSKIDDWRQFANRNRGLLEKTARDMKLGTIVHNFDLNPAVPMMQRGPRYELLLKELAKNLPDSFQPLAQATLLRAKSVTTQINTKLNPPENASPRKEAPQKFKAAGASEKEKISQGFLSRVLNWFGWQ